MLAAPLDKHQVDPALLHGVSPSEPARDMRKAGSFVESGHLPIRLKQGPLKSHR
jgi:hypothetical protein